LPGLNRIRIECACALTSAASRLRLAASFNDEHVKNTLKTPMFRGSSEALKANLRNRAATLPPNCFFNAKEKMLSEAAVREAEAAQC
jgi:hypothetical protein